MGRMNERKKKVWDMAPSQFRELGENQGSCGQGRISEVDPSRAEIAEECLLVTLSHIVFNSLFLQASK